MSNASDLLNNVCQNLYNTFNTSADAIFNAIASLAGKQKTY